MTTPRRHAYCAVLIVPCLTDSVSTASNVRTLHTASPHIRVTFIKDLPDGSFLRWAFTPASSFFALSRARSTCSNVTFVVIVLKICRPERFTKGIMRMHERNGTFHTITTSPPHHKCSGFMDTLHREAVVEHFFTMRVRGRRGLAIPTSLQTPHPLPTHHTSFSFVMCLHEHEYEYV